MDDESYFHLSNPEQQGNNGYYTYDDKNVDPEVKFYEKGKFDTKVLVWVAISSKGKSEPYFVQRNLAVNGFTYKTECIRKRLVPFIKKYHSDGKYIFGPIWLLLIMQEIPSMC
ncbi:uncharacterized protein B4U79_16010 [Dinothrombium tinctorium]|uniref:Uncharacterized protein n=1 Tax=Dinothrombium tinctorium TaxID=1965070 RepID=A0A443QR13_9ACAR|nr:uncharacterized protein B4U79_16010 [Dinothrombium tinctorium]